jgi:hypothetical protein
MELFPSELITDWNIINDGVMGGQSTSAYTIRNTGELLFEGTVSLANGGGFASVKSSELSKEVPDHFSSVKLLLKGDGHSYYLRLYPDHKEKGVAYVHDFKTKPDVWQSIELSLNEFYPTFRGNPIDDMPPLSSNMIRNTGFMIKDGQAGSFRLLVKSVEMTI